MRKIEVYIEGIAHVPACDDAGSNTLSASFALALKY